MTLKQGQKVRFKNEISRRDIPTVPSGSTGEVLKTDKEGAIIKLDDAGLQKQFEQHGGGCMVYDNEQENTLETIN